MSQTLKQNSVTANAMKSGNLSMQTGRQTMSQNLNQNSLTRDTMEGVASATDPDKKSMMTVRGFIDRKVTKFRETEIISNEKKQKCLKQAYFKNNN